MLRNIVQLSSKYLRGANVAKVTSTNSYNHVQLYSRFVGRKHAKIVNEDELFEEPEMAYPEEREIPSPIQNKRSRRGRPNIKAKKQKFVTQEIPEKKTMFTKLYENEKLLSPLMMEVKSKKARRKMNKVLLEGTRLITDAIQGGMVPEKIIFSDFAELAKIPLPNDDINRYKVPYRTIQLWSNLTTPSGIMAIFETPDIEKFESHNSLPITILCDNIRDPGNLGSILRAAAGVGCDKVILTKGCVDLWEPKVLRSAAGAHFRLPIFGYKSWHDIRFLLSPGSKFIVADNRVEEEVFTGKNEPDDVEKLSELDNQDSVEGEENEETDKKSRKYKIETIDYSKKLDIVPYYSLDYTQSETVIIIGGETEGLSENSFKLANDNNGVRVNVPLNNGIESLNSGMALGIIAFEIKRQFLMSAGNLE